MLFDVDATSLSGKFQTLSIRTFLTFGNLLGFYPFNLVGSKVVLERSYIKMGVLAVLFAFVSVVFALFGVFVVNLETSDPALKTRLLFTQLVYGAQILAYYLTVVSFVLISYVHQKRVLKCLNQARNISGYLRNLKSEPSIPLSYVGEMVVMFACVFCLYVVSLAVFVAHVHFMENVMIVATMFFILFLVFLIVGVFFTCFLFYAHVFEIVAFNLGETEKRLSSLRENTSKPFFVNESCLLSDSLDFLAKVQLETHICMKEGTKLVQFPILCIFFLMVIGIVMQVSTLYEDLFSTSVQMPLKHASPWMTLFYLAIFLVQLHFMSRGPQLALVRHHGIIERLNSVSACQIVEGRLDRSLEIFSIQLCQQNPKIYIFGLFECNTSLWPKIIGTCVSYIIIAVQANLSK